MKNTIGADRGGRPLRSGRCIPQIKSAAHPSRWTAPTLTDGYAQAILVNSGNANTCAANGVALAESVLRAGRQGANIPAEDVLPASTGVIGQPWSSTPLPAASPPPPSWAATAQGSTGGNGHRDHRHPPKGIAIQFAKLGGPKTLLRGSLAKERRHDKPSQHGPACCLLPLTKLSPRSAGKGAQDSVPGTYNQMSVDADTSTNDTLIVMASGLAGNPEIMEENADYDAFVAALTAIAEHMCAEHAGDGEGDPPHHLRSDPCPDLKTARAIFRSVVCSNLFKAAVFGRDANWGRILCAIGYTPAISPSIRSASGCPARPARCMSARMPPTTPCSEEEAAKVLAEHDVLVKVDMGTGDASAKAWGCDRPTITSRWQRRLPHLRNVYRAGRGNI